MLRVFTVAVAAGTLTTTALKHEGPWVPVPPPHWDTMTPAPNSDEVKAKEGRRHDWWEDGALKDEDGATGSKCLKFMHIPKTAGTTIEALNLHLPAAVRSFHSIMENVYERVAAEEGTTPSELFEGSHANRSHYAGWLTEHKDVFAWRRMPDNNTCHSIHTPPHLDSNSADFFYEGRCRTFCIVRNPLQRFLSTWKFNEEHFDSDGKLTTDNFECNLPAFEEFTKKMIPYLKERPYENLCHWVPQTEYIYGGPSRERGTGTFCHHVIPMENLVEEFNGLMGTYNRPIRMDANQRFFSTSDCNVSMNDVSPEAKAALYEFYKGDFDGFGYGEPE